MTKTRKLAKEILDEGIEIEISIDSKYGKKLILKESTYIGVIGDFKFEELEKLCFLISDYFTSLGEHEQAQNAELKKKEPFKSLSS